MNSARYKTYFLKRLCTHKRLPGLHPLEWVQSQQVQSSVGAEEEVGTGDKVGDAVGMGLTVGEDSHGLPSCSQGSSFSSTQPLKMHEI